MNPTSDALSWISNNAVITDKKSEALDEFGMCLLIRVYVSANSGQSLYFPESASRRPRAKMVAFATRAS